MPGSRLHSLMVLLFLTGVAVLPFSSSARPVPAKAAAAGVDYAPALAAADHFLQAWQNGDAENGIALLSTRAKERLHHDALEAYFSAHGPLAFEIERGKMLRAGRYSFPVVLVSPGSGKHVRRRFSAIVILNTGHNDWAVDNLP